MWIPSPTHLAKVLSKLNQMPCQYTLAHKFAPPLLTFSWLLPNLPSKEAYFSGMSFRAGTLIYLRFWTFISNTRLLVKLPGNTTTPSASQHLYKPNINPSTIHPAWLLEPRAAWGYYINLWRHQDCLECDCGTGRAALYQFCRGQSAALRWKGFVHGCCLNCTLPPQASSHSEQTLWYCMALCCFSILSIR